MQKEIVPRMPSPTRITPLIEQAKAINITDKTTLGSATELLSKTNLLLDKVVEYKEAKTVPLNTLLKAIRAETKPFESALEGIVSTIKQKMIAYQTAQLKLQTEQENKILKQVEQGTLDPEQAVNQLSTVRDTPDSIQADSGSIKFKPYDGFKVTDVSALPKECLLPNEPKIRELMKGGVKVPGVEYFTEMRPTNYRN